MADFPLVFQNSTGWPWVLAVLGLALVGLWAWRLYRYQRQRQALREALDAPRRPDPNALLAVLGNDDQPSTADTLGFGRVARAVAGLLRNAATGAPYSVVVSGSWGSGKSSVMLQISELLAPSRTSFRTVGLNVWHYQSGQHLLGGFLRELLRACNYPAYRRRFRWGRFREMGFRPGFKLGIAVFLLGPALLYLAGLLLQTPPLSLFTHTPLAAWAHQLAHWLDAQHLGILLAPFRLLALSPALLHLGDDDQNGALLPLWSTALAWLGTLLGLVHTLRSQGGAITELLPLQEFERASVSADAGFRDQYRQQFSDVLRHAPDNLRIVFFVDDVDRIPGSRVLELLESLNYLVEISRDARARADEEVRKAANRKGLQLRNRAPRTGAHADKPAPKAPAGAVARLYFVLGMHVPEVVRSLADALNTDQHLGSAAEARRHAARYLEKMVDLVVPMPTLAQCEPEQVARLLFGIEETAAPEPPLAEAFEKSNSSVPA